MIRFTNTCIYICFKNKSRLIYEIILNNIKIKKKKKRYHNRDYFVTS